MIYLSVHSIFQVARDIWPYFLVQALILITSAVVLNQYYQKGSGISIEHPDVAERYETLPAAFLSTFYMMMGFTQSDDFTTSATLFICVIFLIFVQLIMMNVLIAVMVTITTFKACASESFTKTLWICRFAGR